MWNMGRKASRAASLFHCGRERASFPAMRSCSLIQFSEGDMLFALQDKVAETSQQPFLSPSLASRSTQIDLGDVLFRGETRIPPQHRLDRRPRRRPRLEAKPLIPANPLCGQNCLFFCQVFFFANANSWPRTLLRTVFAIEGPSTY